MFAARTLLATEELLHKQVAAALSNRPGMQFNTMTTKSPNRKKATRPAATGILLGISLAAGIAAAIEPAVSEPAGFADIARRAGEPQVPGLSIVYLAPLGNPASTPWQHIIAHQTEGPAGSALTMAKAQFANPTKRGVMLWVETNGTVYWSTPETAIPTHGDGANRNDNLYIDNAKTFRKVIRTNSIGVEFVGNHPDVSKPVSPQQMQAWLVLVRFLQERYDIPAENIFAHNWIDFKDKRYCEGCDLATAARKLGYVPTGR